MAWVSQILRTKGREPEGHLIPLSILGFSKSRQKQGPECWEGLLAVGVGRRQGKANLQAEAEEAPAGSRPWDAAGRERRILGIRTPLGSWPVLQLRGTGSYRPTPTSGGLRAVP